jgi:hypothetical protein
MFDSFSSSREEIFEDKTNLMECKPNISIYEMHDGKMQYLLSQHTLCIIASTTPIFCVNVEMRTRCHQSGPHVCLANARKTMLKLQALKGEVGLQINIVIDC